MKLASLTIAEEDLAAAELSLSPMTTEIKELEQKLATLKATKIELLLPYIETLSEEKQKQKRVLTPWQDDSSFTRYQATTEDGTPTGKAWWNRKAWLRRMNDSRGSNYDWALDMDAVLERDSRRCGIRICARAIPAEEAKLLADVILIKEGWILPDAQSFMLLVELTRNQEPAK